MNEVNFELENYQLDLVRKPSDTLVVSFEPMTACLRNPSRDRRGWSHTFFRDRSESVLYVKPMQPNWYRRPDLFEWIHSNSEIFSEFDRVVPMGGSMGGYGALAFAEAMQATEVLSLSPQTTLSRDLVPWDNRFPDGIKEDWNGEFRDAAETLSGDVYVIADRFEESDWRHLERLSDVTKINVPLVGHQIPMRLLQLNGLKPISEAILDGKSKTEVVRVALEYVHQRKTLERWWTGLVEQGEKRGKMNLVSKLTTPERIDNAIPIKGDGKRLNQLRCKLYRSVAANLVDQDSDASLVWLKRAMDIEERL